MPHSLQIKKEAIKAVRGGMTLAQAAKKFHVSASAISNWKNAKATKGTTKAKTKTKAKAKGKVGKVKSKSKGH